MTQIIKDLVTWLKQWFYTKDELDASFALKTEIPTNLDPLNHQIPTATSTDQTDLNNYTDVGFYYYNGTSTSMSYIQNCPITFRYFTMLVEGLNANYVKQTVTSFGDTNVSTYVRTKRGNSGWTAWKHITMS